MTELKLLRIEPILPRSTPSTGPSGAASRGATCGTVISGTADDSVLSGGGADTSV